MKHHGANPEEDHSLYRERCEDETKRDDRAEVGHEASGQNRLAILGFVEAEFEHHGIDDSHRSRRHRNPGKPARHDLPA